MDRQPHRQLDMVVCLSGLQQWCSVLEQTKLSFSCLLLWIWLRLRKPYVLSRPRSSWQSRQVPTIFLRTPLVSVSCVEASSWLQRLSPCNQPFSWSSSRSGDWSIVLEISDGTWCTWQVVVGAPKLASFPGMSSSETPLEWCWAL